MSDPTPKSFDGFSLTSGGLFGHFSRSGRPFDREAEPVPVSVAGSFPRLPRTRKVARTFPVHVLVESGDIHTQMALLQQKFATELTAPLIVDWLGEDRAIDCTVLRAIQHAEGIPNQFTAILHAPDPRWRSVSAVETVTNVITSGQAFNVTNLGNADEDRAVIRVRPTNLKEEQGEDFRYYREIIIANVQDRIFGDYAIEITDGGWDHAAEVAAGRALANGNDIRVLLDGVPTPWWSENLNNAATKIWSNISLSPRRTAKLLNAITAVSPADGEDLTFEPGDGADLPDAGVMRFGDEVIRWSSKDRDTVKGIVRGDRHTAAAAHAAGLEGFWVERRIQLLYGYSDATAPTPRPDLEPLIDLSASTNDSHVWNEFYDDDNPARSMAWARVVRDRDSQASRLLLPEGSPATSIAFEYQEDGPEAGKPNVNTLHRRFPSGLANAGGGNALSLTRAIDDTLALKILGRDNDGNEEELSAEGGPVASGTLNIGEPASPIFDVDLYVRTQIVEGNPEGAATADLQIGVTAYDDTAQQFTAPADFICIGVQCRLWLQGSTTLQILCRLMSDDSDTPGTALTSEESTGNIVGPEAEPSWRTFKWDDPVDLFSGEKYWLDFRQNNPMAAAVLNGFAQVYPGGIQLNSGVLQIDKVGQFRLIGLDAETLGSFAKATDGDQVTADAITATLDSTKTPYLNMLARRDAYWMDGVLASSATGQQLVLAVLMELNEELEIDVGARTVRNLTTDESMPWAVTPSDRQRWLTIQPGVNELTWTEPGLDAVTVDVDVVSRWE